MKKASLIFILIALVLLCACNNNTEDPTVNRQTQPSYTFQSNQIIQPTVNVEQNTTQLHEGNTVSTQIFYTSANIWSDFEDIQRYDNTQVDLTASAKDITVFNYPLQTVLAYFSEIAFADEGEGAIGKARKWIKPIYYEIYGSADDVDVAAIRWTAEQLNSINGFPGMFAATPTNKANVKFYFGNITYIQSALGITDNTARSCTRLFYNTDDFRIQLAKIGIVSDTTSRTDRNSLILEEIFQMLGLNQNSLNYPQSLFYKANTDPQVPDELDMTLVKLLYSPALQSGMNKADGITAVADVLVSRYESGVVYTEPNVDFALLALEYSITTVTDAPTEEPTSQPTNNDPTYAPTDAPTEEPTDAPTQAPSEPEEDEPSTKPIPIIIPTSPMDPTTDPTDPPEESTDPSVDDPDNDPTEPSSEEDSEPMTGTDVPDIEL